MPNWAQISSSKGTQTLGRLNKKQIPNPTLNLFSSFACCVLESCDIYTFFHLKFTFISTVWIIYLEQKRTRSWSHNQMLQHLIGNLKADMAVEIKLHFKLVKTTKIVSQFTEWLIWTMMLAAWSKVHIFVWRINSLFCCMLLEQIDRLFTAMYPLHPSPPINRASVRVAHTYKCIHSVYQSLALLVLYRKLKRFVWGVFCVAFAHLISFRLCSLTVFVVINMCFIMLFIDIGVLHCTLFQLKEHNGSFSSGTAWG